jgi:hypothetical protein
MPSIRDGLKAGRGEDTLESRTQICGCGLTMSSDAIVSPSIGLEVMPDILRMNAVTVWQ